MIQVTVWARRRGRTAVWGLPGGLAALALLGGCGGGATVLGDGGGPAACSANVPAGQACNAVADVSTAVMPTCTTAAMGAGMGGPIFDGTYVLKSQTYYGTADCSSKRPVSGTLVIAGNCFQSATMSTLQGTGSTVVSVSGNMLTMNPVCQSFNLDGGAVSPDVLTKTFTATATSLTIFDLNSASGNPNPDRIEVFTKL